VWGQDGVIIDAMAHCVDKIVRGQVFGPSNRKLGCVGLDLICSAQNKAHHIEGVCKVGLVSYLTQWRIALIKSRGGRVLAHQTGNWPMRAWI